MKEKKFATKALSLLLAVMMAFSAAFAVPVFTDTDIVYAASSKKQISKCKITYSASATYTGKTIKPKIKVTYGKTTLKSGKHYTVKYSNNKNVGTAKITVTGISKGGYTGSKTVKFSIVPKKATSLKATKATTTSISLSWKAVSGATGYVVYSYNAKTKKYTKLATAKKNSATISKLKAGTDYVFAVKAYKTVSKKNYYSDYSSKLNASTVVSAPTGVSATASGSGKAIVTWKKVTGATGYAVYSYDTKTKKYTKLTTVKATTASVKETGKKYAVRAYKTVGKTTTYSAYSTAVSAKKVFKTDRYAEIFKNGTFQMSFTSNDKDLGTEPITFATKSNGDFAMKMNMAVDESTKVEMRVYYNKKSNKTYLITMGMNFIVPAGDDSLDFSEISNEMKFDTSPTGDYIVTNETVGGKTYTVEEIEKSNGDTTKFYYDGDTLVKIVITDGRYPNEPSVFDNVVLTTTVDEKLFKKPAIAVPLPI